MLRRAFLVGSLVATAVLMSGPAAAARTPPGRTATFGIGPSDGSKLDGRPYLTFLTAAGARLEDHVAIVNLATRPVTLQVYAVDAVTGADGSFSYAARSAPREDAGSWIAAQLPHGGDTLRLAPRSTVIVPVEVTIPASATPGDHAAGVVASLTSQVRNRDGERVDFEQRVAVRTLFRVAGALHPQLSVEHLKAAYSGSIDPIGSGTVTVTVTYTVHNTGNVQLGARQQVVVSGMFAATTAHRAANVPVLLPGGSVHESVTIRHVIPQGPMHARVTLYPLTLPGDVDPGLPTRISTTAPFWALPWALLVTVAVLVALVLGLLLWRRRRRNRPPRGRHMAVPTRPDGPRDALVAPEDAKQGVSG